MNDSTETTITEDEIPYSVRIILEIIIILVLILGVPGNLVTLVTVAQCKRLHTSGTVLIAALSLTDVLYYITVLPFRMALFAGAWPSGGPQHWLCAVSAGTAHWFFGVSMSCMSCIAFNRYTHVLRPGLYKILFSRKGLVMQFGTMWLLVGLLTVVFPLSGTWGDYIYSHDILSCTFNTEKHTSFQYIVLGIGLVIPCAFIITCYSLIYYNVRTSQRRLQSWTKVKPNSQMLAKSIKVQPVAENTGNGSSNQDTKRLSMNYQTSKNETQEREPTVNKIDTESLTTSSTSAENDGGGGSKSLASTVKFDRKKTSHSKPAPLSQQEKQRRASLRMTAMMVLTFGVFLVFMAPYIILGVVDPDREHPLAYLFALSLTWWNGCVNPVIYVAMNGQFRRATKEMLHCKQRHGQQQNGQDFSVGT